MYARFGGEHWIVIRLWVISLPPFRLDFELLTAFTSG
jgi:hypothetical protein